MHPEYTIWIIWTLKLVKRGNKRKQTAENRGNDNGMELPGKVLRVMLLGLGAIVEDFHRARIIPVMKNLSTSAIITSKEEITS